MHSYEGEYKAFKILYQVIEGSESFCVFALCAVNERVDFGGRETNMFFAHHYF